jgi:hypothetical protein
MQFPYLDHRGRRFHYVLREEHPLAWRSNFQSLAPFDIRETRQKEYFGSMCGLRKKSEKQEEGKERKPTKKKRAQNGLAAEKSLVGPPPPSGLLSVLGNWMLDLRCVSCCN